MHQNLRVHLLACAWIVLSGAVILINKVVLKYFRYPISLALSHMVCAACMTRILFSLFPRLKSNDIEDSLGPLRLAAHFGGIGVIFACTLVTSNAALSRLDVPLIQMLKSLNPVLIYMFATIIGLDLPDCRVASSTVVTSVGVLISVFGSGAYSHVGLLMQMCSIVSDALRITAVHATLHSSKCDIDPINMLHLLSPGTSLLLWVTASLIEFPGMAADLPVPIHLIGASAILAFALNVTSYAFIKGSSALTLSITGIIKDVLLAGISCLFFGSRITAVQAIGYTISIGGTILYKSARDKRRGEVKA